MYNFCEDCMVANWITFAGILPSFKLYYDETKMKQDNRLLFHSPGLKIEGCLSRDKTAHAMMKRQTIINFLRIYLISFILLSFYTHSHARLAFQPPFYHFTSLHFIPSHHADALSIYFTSFHPITSRWRNRYTADTLHIQTQSLSSSYLIYIYMRILCCSSLIFLLSPNTIPILFSPSLPLIWDELEKHKNIAKTNPFTIPTF